LELRVTPRAVTPFGGLVVFLSYCGRWVMAKRWGTINRFVSLPPARRIPWRPSRHSLF